MGVPPLFLLHSQLLVCFNAVFPLQTPASVMELVDVPDSKSGAARRGGSSPPRGTIKPQSQLPFFGLKPSGYFQIFVMAPTALNNDSIVSAEILVVINTILEP
jgi:hypothetical protein